MRHSARPVPARRLVYDADGRWVGAVRGRRLEDRGGRVVAVRGPDPRRAATCSATRTAGRWRRCGRARDGAALAFTEAAAADPFAKMLVLAAALHG